MTRRPPPSVWSQDSFKAAHGVFVTADSVILSLDSERRELRVRVIRRAGQDQTGRVAVPGGYIEPDETLAQAAAREAAEESGVEVDGLFQAFLDVYDDPDRAEGKRVIGSAFVAFGVDVETTANVEVDGDAVEPQWLAVSELNLFGQARQSGRTDLAFEGAQMVAQALSVVRHHFDVHAPTKFMPMDFTIKDLRSFYEALHAGSVVQLGEFERRLHNGLALDKTKGRSPDGSPYLQWVVPDGRDEPAWDINVSGLVLAPGSRATVFEFGQP